MKIVFADTGYWIALINKKDSLHKKARQVTLEMYPNLEHNTLEKISLVN